MNDQFETPIAPPQMEAESNQPILDLMFNAPKWDDAFAAELTILARKHVALRSALGYVLEVAKTYEQLLITGNEPADLYRAQGAIQGLQRVFNVLLTHMQEAEKNRETLQ